MTRAALLPRSTAPMPSRIQALHGGSGAQVAPTTASPRGVPSVSPVLGRQVDADDVSPPRTPTTASVFGVPRTPSWLMGDGDLSDGSSTSGDEDAVQAAPSTVPPPVDSVPVAAFPTDSGDGEDEDDDSSSFEDRSTLAPSPTAPRDGATTTHTAAGRPPPPRPMTGPGPRPPPTPPPPAAKRRFSMQGPRPPPGRPPPDAKKVASRDVGRRRSMPQRILPPPREGKRRSSLPATGRRDERQAATTPTAVSRAAKLAQLRAMRARQRRSKTDNASLL